jgi:hypothetical protein
MGYSRAIAGVGMTNHLKPVFRLGTATRKGNKCSSNSNL